MLRRPSEMVADAYQRASAAAERAGRSSNPDDREFWLACEQRWLEFAKHLEDCERLNDFVASRGSFSGYRIRKTDNDLWEWFVVGKHPNIVFAGIAESSVAARVEVYGFIADLDEVPLN